MTVADIFDHSDIVSFIGAFVVGILGNLYSRVFRGTGFVVMVPGVLFLVPVSSHHEHMMTSPGAHHKSICSLVSRLLVVWP